MHKKSSKSVEELIELLQPELRTLARMGSATPSDLVFGTPTLFGVLKDIQGENTAESAAKQLRLAVEQLPPRDRRASEVILGLDEATRGQKLGVRRERAAECLGVKPSTFRTHHETRLLQSIAERCALGIYQRDAARRSAGSTEADSGSDPRRVLLIHSLESQTADELKKFLMSLGLDVVSRDQALELAGVSSPLLLEGFRTSLEVAQAIVVLLDEQSGRARDNLLLEAGLAVGLAASRTIFLHVGSQPIPTALSGIQTLRLSNVAEGRMALMRELRRAGCAVDASGTEQDAWKGDLATGWYRLTSEIRIGPMADEIDEAIERFRGVGDYGQAATDWLQKRAITESPGVATYLFLHAGRIEGFVSLTSASAFLTTDSQEKREAGATRLLWLACHQEADPGVEEALLLQALAVSSEASERQGSVALIVEPFGAEDAKRWAERYKFRAAGDSGFFWHALRSPEEVEEQSEPKAASPGIPAA
jgi:hypothetical protein